MLFRSMAYGHAAELVHGEQTSVASHTLLLENHRASGHLYFDKDGHNEQYRPQRQQAEKRHEPVKDVFKCHIYECNALLDYGFNLPFFTNFDK